MPRYIGTTNTAQIVAGGAWTGASAASDNLYAFMQNLGGIFGSAKAAFSISDVYSYAVNNTWSAAYFDPAISTISPTAGGTITINSQSLGSYDFVTKNGNTTISSFSNADWFTATSDTRSALIYINGNLTINSGQTVIPSNRKLFTAIYVNGNLTINGSVSMTDRGANHNGTGNSGGAVTAATIKLANGTYSGVSNPQIPATGGAGGAPASNGPGPAGTAGTSGGTGGGGGGGKSDPPGSGGAGASGTSFVGGSGGGGAQAATTGGAGVANGGAGGAGTNAGQDGGGGGGGGQPGGAGAQQGPYPSVAGNTGIAGTIVIYCTGTFSGTGSVVSTSSGTGGLGWNGSGGSSGGGSITIFSGTDSSSITPTAAGASSTASNAGAPGGAGGAGTARKLSF